MTKSTRSQLEDEKEEVESHYNDAIERIQTHYQNPGESPYDVAPHEKQFQIAAHYLEYAITEIHDFEQEWQKVNQDQEQLKESEDPSVEWRKRRSWARLRLTDLMFGVALEILVSAIHLKLDPDGYVDRLSETCRTPYFFESVDKLKEDLDGEIDEEDIEEISLLLDLVKKKRNNLVHFGFAYNGAHYFPSLVIDASGFLITRYASTNEIPELDSLAEYSGEFHNERSEIQTYPKLRVNFEPFS